MENEKSLKWVSSDPSPPKILFKCALVAFVLEALAITLIGWHEHWLAHPQKSNTADETRFIEAQVFQIPKESHLVEEQKKTSVVKKIEPTLSRVPQDKPSKAPSGPAQPEENQTESGPKMAPSHGPVAIFAPPPVIPSYLQYKDLKTHVIIDFFVTNQGSATPKLVGSSGDEELDALALEAVKKWQFRPAEQDHKPVDSKVRLRILFEVK